MSDLVKDNETDKYLKDLIKKRDRVYPHEVHIDATPDGDYALRILQFYRDRCNEKWSASTSEIEDDENLPLLFNIMNQHQDQRAEELDKAIEILKNRRRLIKGDYDAYNRNPSKITRSNKK